VFTKSLLRIRSLLIEGIVLFYVDSMSLEFILHLFCVGFKGVNAKLVSSNKADIRF